jgi:Acyl-CoA carboxylase epsilon subunit
MPSAEDKDLAAELEVVAGNPTEQDLAAVVAVLREAVGTTESAQLEPNWAKGSQMLRESNGSGALEWRADFKGEI